MHRAVIFVIARLSCYNNLQSKLALNENTATFRIALMLLVCAGNDNIYLITNRKRHALRIELTDFDGNVRYAEYSDFIMLSGRYQYKLLFLGKYEGDAGQCGTKTLLSLFIRAMNRTGIVPVSSCFIN